MPTRRKPSNPDYASQAAAQAAQYAVPRTDYSGLPTEDQLTRKFQTDPNFVIPQGYEEDPNVPGRIRRVGSGSTFLDKWGFPLMAGIVGGGTLAAGLGGGAAAAGDVASMPPATGGIPAGVKIGASTPIPGGGGGGIMSSIGNWLKGINPTTAILGGLSLLGKDPQNFQERHSFGGTAIDPTSVLTEQLAAIKNLSNTIANANAPSVKSAVVAEGPRPVTIDGIPFQIGGGLGRDPALKDPSLLESNKIDSPFGLPQTAKKRSTT